MDWKFDEQAAIRRAYMTLLELPHGGLRARLQSVLATLRDEVAIGCSDDPQTVQDDYERWVAAHPSEYACPPIWKTRDADA